MPQPCGFQGCFGSYRSSLEIFLLFHRKPGLTGFELPSSKRIHIHHRSCLNRHGLIFLPKRRTRQMKEISAEERSRYYKESANKKSSPK